MTTIDTDELDAEGYVVLRAALTSDRIDRLRRAFEQAPVRRDGTQHVEIEEETPELDTWLELKEYVLLRRVADRLLGCPYAFRVHGRNPLPGYGQQGLHADSQPRQPGDPVLAVTAIWMLDAFTVENGATRVVPRTHLLPHAVPRRYAQPLAHHPQELVVTAPAGSVLIFNGHLWHSGRQNQSLGPRRAVQMTARAA